MVAYWVKKFAAQSQLVLRSKEESLLRSSIDPSVKW